MSDIPRPPRKGQDPPAARHLRLVSDKPTPPRPKQRHRRVATFSPEETSRLRAALKHARALFGSWPCLSDALRMSEPATRHAANGSSGFSGDLAVRLARALGKPLESLYRAPAAADVCPTCGAKRGTP
mgnify:CR=1 FL=1